MQCSHHGTYLGSKKTAGNVALINTMQSVGERPYRISKLRSSWNPWRCYITQLKVLPSISKGKGSWNEETILCRTREIQWGWLLDHLEHKEAAGSLWMQGRASWWPLSHRRKADFAKGSSELGSSFISRAPGWFRPCKSLSRQPGQATVGPG